MYSRRFDETGTGIPSIPEHYSGHTFAPTEATEVNATPQPAPLKAAKAHQAFLEESCHTCNEPTEKQEPVESIFAKLETNNAHEKSDCSAPCETVSCHSNPCHTTHNHSNPCEKPKEKGKLPFLSGLCMPSSDLLLMLLAFLLMGGTDSEDIPILLIMLFILG